MTDDARNLIAATFPTPDAGSRAAAAVGGAFPDKIGNAAVLFVKPDGTAKFVSRRTGAPVAARCWAAPSASSAARSGSWQAAASARSRPSCGTRASRTTSWSASAAGSHPNNSAVVIEIAADAVDVAKRLLEPLGAPEIVVQDVDTSVATLFNGDAAPTPETDEAASPVG